MKPRLGRDCAVWETEGAGKGEPVLASVIIPTKNAGPLIGQCLEMVLSQHCSFTYEVIAIDSGSTDETVHIMQEFPIRLYEIPSYEFGHGRTRNLGARLTQGEYLVYLTQDAKPANEWWLRYLVGAVADDERIAGGYSRQIPYDGCNPCEARDLRDYMPLFKQIRAVDLSQPFEREYYHEHMSDLITFSNVSSCLRRSVWREHPFDETLIMCEDQKWCKDVLEAGYRVVYEPYSTVLHSHDFRPKEIYNRNLEYGLSFRHFAKPELNWWRATRRYGLQLLLDWLYLVNYRAIWLSKLKWIFLIPFYRGAQVYGLWRGWQGFDKM